MSQAGFITFYCIDSIEDLARLARDINGYIVADRVWGAYRTRESVGLGSNVFRSVDAPGWSGDDPESCERLLENRTSVSADDVVAWISNGHCLLLDRIENLRCTHVVQAIRSAIPDDIAGDFVPSGPYIRLGWHDVWEDAEQARGHLFGRASWSLSLAGYGTPNDWPEYRRMVLEVPELVAFGKGLSEATGCVLHSCVYWSI